jgi:hypothetical protein
LELSDFGLNQQDVGCWLADGLLYNHFDLVGNAKWQGVLDFESGFEFFA